MKSKPLHTFTWLKVLTPVLILEMVALYIISGMAGDKSPALSSFLLSVGLLVSLLGLLFGLLLNHLTKFTRTTLYYILGHIISITILFTVGYMMIGAEVPNNNYRNLPGETTLVADPNDTSSAILSSTDKHAIEQVIFLMEEQYPFGAYDIVDIITGYAKDDSSAITCTIVFTLEDEINKKYISQYIVKGGAIEPVYTKKDTTSTGYKEYKLKKSASRY